VTAVPDPRRGAAVPRRRRRPAPAQPVLPLPDPGSAFDTALKPVPDLDALAERYPDREITLSSERSRLEFYSSAEQPNAFAMDSLEFLLVVAQYFREALPLRLIMLMIACQRAGGRIELTQEEMARVLEVPRARLSEALGEIMDHGIVYKVGRGVYQFNPPYSYRIGEWIPGTELVRPEYRRVDQRETISRIRGDQSLPDLVRFPNLDAMRREIERIRRERAQARAERRRRREGQHQQDEEAGR
jgi:hypothetical protein